MAVQFFFSEAPISLPERTRLKRFIEEVFIREAKVLQTLTYIFCSDEYLLDINRRFLQHDYYTDIITFDLSENTQAVSGEIYISVDRVKENAKNHQQKVQHELHRVIFHGALHLCGYKDKMRSEVLQMRQKEEECLALYFK